MSSPELPSKTEAIVRNLARIYAVKGQPEIVELLAKSSAEMVETSFDNWNGGTYGFTLRLNAPAHLYAALDGRSIDLEKELLERAAPFLRGFPNETLDEVAISLELESDESWRENALQWLRAKTSSIPADSELVDYDFFISHASEDKSDLVRPLAQGLRDGGARVWYDEFSLTIGDGLRRSIDRGLAKSRFGVVVLSPSFFAKNWTQYELDGLTTRQVVGRKVILPIWHNLSRDAVAAESPSLADMLAFSSETMSIPEMVSELISMLEMVD